MHGTIKEWASEASSLLVIILSLQLSICLSVRARKVSPEAVWREAKTWLSLHLWALTLQKQSIERASNGTRLALE